MRRIGSGMSKCTSAISATVRSASSCIQSRKASLPCDPARGSASRWATAPSTSAPGQDPVGGRRPSRRRAAAAPPSPTRRSRRGRPRRRGSSGRRARRARGPRRPAPAARRSSSLEEAAERRDGGAGRRRAARGSSGAGHRPRAARPGRGRSRRRRPSCPVQRRTCSATSAYCRAAETLPWRGLVRERGAVAARARPVRRPAGRRRGPASSPSVGIRSKTLAQLVQRAGRCTDICDAVDAGVVSSTSSPSALEERVLAPPPRARRPASPPRRPPAPRGRGPRARVEAVGGVVGQLVLVAGDPDVGRGQRVEGGRSPRRTASAMASIGAVRCHARDPSVPRAIVGAAAACADRGPPLAARRRCGEHVVHGASALAATALQVVPTAPRSGRSAEFCRNSWAGA